MSTSKTLIAAIISSLLCVGCSKKGAAPEAEMAPKSVEPETTVVAEPAPPQEEEAPPAEPVEDTPAAAPLTDAQIAKVLSAVDTGEIEQAKIAQKKSKNPKVKKFAAMMIQHHTKTKTKGAAWAKKAKITPEDSTVATALTGKATQSLEELKTADAATIDALYIEGQLQQHQAVNDLISAQLIPAAQDEQLKSMLAEVRTLVEGHISTAKEIQAALPVGASGAGATSASP